MLVGVRQTSVESAEAVEPSEDVISSVGAVGYNLSGLFPLPLEELLGGVGFEITPISTSLGSVGRCSSNVSSSSLLSFASDSACSST